MEMMSYILEYISFIINNYTIIFIFTIIVIIILRITAETYNYLHQKVTSVKKKHFEDQQFIYL